MFQYSKKVFTMKIEKLFLKMKKNAFEFLC